MSKLILLVLSFTIDARTLSDLHSRSVTFCTAKFSFLFLDALFTNSDRYHQSVYGTRKRWAQPPFQRQPRRAPLSIFQHLLCPKRAVSTRSPQLFFLLPARQKVSCKGILSELVFIQVDLLQRGGFTFFYRDANIQLSTNIDNHVGRQRTVK